MANGARKKSTTSLRQLNVQEDILILLGKI